MPNFLLERNKMTLAKLLASTIIKRVITQIILLNLSQKSSYSLSNYYINDRSIED